MIESLARSGPSPSEERELFRLLVSDAGAEFNCFALSFAQERLWFLDRLEPGSPAYNVPTAVRLSGRLDAAALLWSLAEIVRRHEVLRTRFVELDGRPVQSVLPPPALALPRIALGGLEKAGRLHVALALAARETGRPFDLRRAPLLRLVLVELGEREHLVILTLHHIVSDGWSTGVLLRELQALYEAAVRGLPSPLPDLPLQYADFARWQREWLAGRPLADLLSYWTGRLGGELPAAELPTDRPRGAHLSSRGARRGFALSSGLSAAVLDLSRRHRATPFITLLAAFKALLHRHGGQRDVVVGTPIAGRNRAEIEGLIGLFVNTLVLRTDLGGDPAFAVLLRRVQEVAVGAYAHQDLPFDKLVEALAPERQTSRSPLFQVCFALHNQPLPRLVLAGVELVPEEVPGGSAKFELSLSLAEGAEGFAAAFEYSTDLFDGSTIGRLARRFAVLLEGAVAGPERRLAELPLLDLAERQQVVREWNDTAAEPSADLVHRAFEAVAEGRRDALALCATGLLPEESLTYGELDRRADRLAAGLRARGIGPEARVGLAAGRTPGMATALLGVLKAGGAYLPLDPAAPAERLALVIADAGLALVLAEPDRLAGLPRAGCPALPIAAAAASGGPPRPSAGESEGDGEGDGDGAAYVIYTSGSTGRPKGVVTPHRALANHLRAVARAYGLTGADRVLQFASLAFDVAAEELFATWLAGAAAVLRPEELFGSFPAFDAYAQRHRLTVLNLPASWWHEWTADLAREGRRPAASLRLVVVGNEAVRSEALAAWRGLAGGVEVRNAYGPTEATIGPSLFAPRRGSPPARQGTVSIGRPIANVRISLLDRRLAPVPVGAAGEICVGGRGLARGYLGAPGPTAERFVPDPLGARAGGRLYRTGDLARRLGDGGLEFLGRADEQVKVRGFRIELGEIAAALGRQPGVGRAAVVARPDGVGQPRLVAYVEAAGGGPPPSAAALSARLRLDLPEYMLPAAFVAVERLPLLASGKLDRRALPEPPAAAADPAPDDAPRGPFEVLLAEIWSELLEVPRVGREASFFELGGHSLSATQVASRVRAAFGVELPLRQVFATPTLARLAAAIAELRQDGAEAAPPLGRRAPGEAPPLSFAQERLWFLARLDPASAAYNMPLALRADGPLDPAALAGGLADLAARHEVLRTTLDEVDGRPVQVVGGAWGGRLRCVSLAGVPPERREAEARRLAAAEAARPFALEEEPPLRCLALRLAAERWVVVLTLHHAAGDAWSIGILVRELALLYAGRRSGAPAALPPLPVQYGDFAAWQREWLSDRALARGLDFWRRSLAGCPRVLELPTDRPRPPVPSGRGAVVASRLAPALASALAAAGRREGATPFMTLLAGFQALLGRYSGQRTLLVGTPEAGRGRLELEGLIGCFVNLLVVAADLGGGPSFRRLLGRVREAVLAAHDHGEVPFERLVEELEPERDLSRSPLVQVLFALQNAPAPPVDLDEVALRPVPVETRSARFDLALSAAADGGGFALSLEYATDLFDAATALRLLGHLRVLLGGAAADPQARAGELPLMAAAERQQLLEEWNDSRRPGAPLAPVPEQVAAQAARTPDAVAVDRDGDQLGYGELRRRTARLARRLAGAGVGPEVLVGIALSRSTDLPAILLAVLEAGGAYLPLDPALPPERLAWMLEDSAAPLVLSEPELAAALPGAGAPGGPEVLCLAAGWADGPGPPAAVEPPRPAAEQRAYVLYTSGSTGRPKGVEVPHRALASFLASMAASPGLAARDRLAAVTTLSFDIAGLELFLPLACGARLELVDRGTAADGTALAARLAACRATVMQATPATWRMLLEGGWRAGGPLAALCGGEALDAPLARRLLGEVESLWNLYGPTETTIWSLVQPVTGVQPVAGGEGAVPIGRPIADTRLQVLDRGLSPVPAGVPGELHIGGVGVARGYLRRPALTAERFLPERGAPAGGARMYRTGDRVRVGPGGRLEFLGRLDHQVKIRGHRVEPGEIEAALASHPALERGVVVAREEAPGERRLVAYVVPRKGSSPEAGELRAFLARRVPDYMLPSVWVVLERLPLTPSGKVDRRALPAPTGAAPEPGRAFVAPRGPLEEVVAQVWASVLGLPRVGAHDNFFELGGHSLALTRCLARLREACGAELPVRAFFERPTVAALAELLAEQRRGGGEEPWPPLAPAPPGTPAPLSFAQQRLWFLDQLEPGSTAYNLPAAVEMRGRLAAAALAAAFGEVTRRHEVLRTTFPAVAGRPQPRVAPARRFALPVVDLVGLAAGARRRAGEGIAAAEARRPFDLARGPLLRAALLRLGGDEHLLLIDLHHIVSDAWSTAILVRELAHFYSCGGGPGAPRLPELPIQYADFARWQRRCLAGPRLEAQLAYWRRTLGGDPPALHLPADFPPTAAWGKEGAKARLSLSPELTADLKRLASREGATPFMALLAALKLLLARHSGQEDVVVGAPVASRGRSEAEGLIGCFLNNLALRTDLSGASSFRQLLRRVREGVLAAFAHQDLPFERLVEEVQPHRDLARHPIFEVMLNYVSTPQEPLALPGLTLVPAAPAEPESKFAMTLYAEEREGSLQLQLVYPRRRFAAQRMAGFVAQLGTLLERVTAAPDAALEACSLLGPGDPDWLPDPRLPLAEPEFDTVIHRFACWARDLPEQAALTWHRRPISYGRLAAAVAEIAERLRREGLGPGDVVAVAGERSPGLVASILAVLAAGCVLLTLDGKLPAARRRRMLELAGARRVIRAGGPREPEEPEGVAELAVAADLDPAGAGEGAAAPAAHGSLVERVPRRAGDESAYVFFTSGTTGAPKGVLGRGRGLAHFLAWQRESFGVGPGDRAAQLTGLSFDVVLRDVLLPLASGATLCLPPDDDLGADRILPWLAAEGITLLHTVPALARSWLAQAPAVLAPPPLRWTFFAGEPLTDELVRRWRRSFPGGGVANLYGPTETTLAKCCYLVPEEPLPGVQPVGYALPQSQALVLGPGLRRCAMGEVGEIVVRTPFRSLGYLAAAEEDRRRFCRNPFGDGEDDLLYASGDRGRYRPDGSLEILGRLDDQVKVRGVRVEPAEVRGALERHPQVRAAEVLAREREDGERYLVAYLVPAPGSRPTASELRRFAGLQLPDSMVPAAFVLLEELPLNANGKVDRARLPEPDGARPTLEVAFVAPRSRLEEAIAAVWRERLGVEKVGVEDNFFDLGGHSLLLLEVRAALEQALGRELPVVTLFQYPTVGSLAQHLSRAGAGATAEQKGYERAERRSRTAARRAVRAPQRAAQVTRGGRDEPSRGR